MSFHDFFRRFIGIPPRYNSDDDHEHHFRNPIWDQDEDDNDYLDDNFTNSSSAPFGFQIFTGDPMDIHRYFEQQFDEMLKSFRVMEGALFGSDDSGMMMTPELLPPEPDNPMIQENIRDRYLKPSYERSVPSGTNKSDSDLDGSLNAGDLRALIPSESPPSFQPLQTSRSIMSKTIRLPDGRIEHHKKVIGSDGKERHTVTRQIGQQTHSVTTVTGNDGLSTKEEDFVNLSQSELKDFDIKWERLGKEGSGQNHHHREDVLPPGGLLSILDKIFKY